MSDDPALRLAWYPHRYHTVLRPSDGVGDGHVPNSVIAALGDDAREGIHTTIMGGRLQGHALQLVESNFRFFHEMTCPGDLTIGVALVAIGTSSIREVLGFFRDDRCLVLSRLAIVKAVAGRSVPLTPEERARAAPFLVPG